MKPRDRIETLEADFEINFSDKEGYAIRRSNKGNRSAGKPSGKSRLSFLIGVVIFGLVVLVAVVFHRSSNIDTGYKLKSLERRIKRLEERLYTLGSIEANLEQVKEKSKQFNLFRDTIKKPITPPKSTTTEKPITPPKSTTTEKPITPPKSTTTEKPITPPKSTTTEKPITPPESTTAQTAKEQIEAVYHEVLPGETLYGIGLRYGIAVDELLRLNDLEPGATIYPRQKILISPAYFIE